MSKFGRLQGIYQYLATFYDNRTGNEGPPSNPSSDRNLETGGYMNVTQLPVSTDPQVTHVRVYRVGGNLGEFTLVRQVANGTTSFIDNTADDNLSGTLLSSSNAGIAPLGLKYLQQAYAMLFGAVGPQLRFTPVGYPDRWPATYYLQFEADITGIAPVANGILVFTKFKTYIVTGTGPTSLSQYLLSSDQGCISYESVQLIGTEAIWASLDGICSSSGNRPQVVTKEKLGKISLNPVDSVIYDEVYYLVEAERTLVMDRGMLWWLNVGVSSMAVAQNVLYGRKEDGRLYEMFASDEDAVFKFKSSRMTEGSLTNNKVYKKLFTWLEGQATINIIIDDVLVQSKQLSGKDSFETQVPQPKQRGFYMQLDIVGQGVIRELEYVIGTN